MSKQKAEQQLRDQQFQLETDREKNEASATTAGTRRTATSLTARSVA